MPVSASGTRHERGPGCDVTGAPDAKLPVPAWVERTESADLVIAKRLLDYAKQGGFAFQRTAPGEDGPLVGCRVGDSCIDLIHIEGFSHDCFAWRKRVSPLIVSNNTVVQQVEGGVLEVPNDVLTWERGRNYRPPLKTPAGRRWSGSPDARLPAVSRSPTLP